MPGRGGDLADCAEARAKAQDRNARTVHRLDMDTSGLLLFGKGAEMHRRLSKMFAARDVEKRYLAWVQGVMVAEAGEIDLPLAVDWPNRPKQKIDAEGGKPSRISSACIAPPSVIRSWATGSMQQTRHSPAPRACSCMPSGLFFIIRRRGRR